MSPVVSEFQRRSLFLVVAAMLGLPAAELSAFRSASETLRQAGLGIFGDRGGRNPPPATPAAPVTPALPSPRRLQVSPTSQASSRLPRSSSDDFGRRHARSPSVSRSSVHPHSLSASARGSQSAPSSPTRNVFVRRPRFPSVARSGAKRQHSPDSDADSSGSALVSGHVSSRSSTSSRSRKKARATPTTSPVSSKQSSSRRSTNKKAAKSRAAVSYSPSEDSDDEDRPAPLRRPRRTATANCSAIQRLLHAGESDSDSAVLGEAAAVSSSSGCDRQASSRSSAVSSTSAPPPSSPVPSSSPTQAPPGSVADLASANASVSSSALAEDPEGADSSGVESSSTSRQTEAASSLSGATKSVVIRALPPGKRPAWSPSDSDSDGGDSTGGGSAATPPNLSNKLVESSDSSGDESTLAGSSKPKSQTVSTAGSGSPPLASPTVAVRPPQVTISAPVSATAKAPVPFKTPPLARSPPKPASKAKSPAAIRSAKDGSKPKSASKPSASKAKLTASDTKARAKSDGGVPPHHVDVKVLVARAAASAMLDSRESGPTKRLRELPFFHKGSKRCWEKIMSSCAVSVTMEKTADGERIKPTPCSIAGLAAFMDVDDSGHPWRSVLRLLPHSLFFVDDSVLEVCPPVEKGKRSKKPGSLLEVLSHEWCKSRGVVREDILLVLWERMHWIVVSSVNIWLAEAFLASERTSRIDYEFTALWKSLKDYLLGRKQRSDLLRLTVKVLGDAVVGAANQRSMASRLPWSTRRSVSTRRSRSAHR
ncbi:unnamed protein product [Phytophthora fragariaefolia]|uniref:Unnamed protein product n=1 Tax=Phytophthora fragariaefolia TaxID=1490495 RepID=A0A9W6YBE2_9STRA|nr:unnamed protein product [Phytophthora fragariaefolia]